MDGITEMFDIRQGHVGFGINLPVWNSL